MLGEIYYDMNNIETAEAYYTLAIEAAHEVDNHVLKATALGRKAFLLVYSGKYEDALPILQEASSLAEKTATGKTRAWITMMEAEALSHLKKESACFSALEKTEQEFGRGQSSTGEEIGWTGFTQSRLIGYKGSCYVRLELPEEARAMINASLAAFSSAPTHRKSLLLSDLATTYIQQGEVEETCKIATEALLCAAQTKSSRALVRLREFQQTLKEWKDVASVKRFNAYLKTVRSV
jgi:tetratricopeptide (TPR) repeat protein